MRSERFDATLWPKIAVWVLTAFIATPDIARAESDWLILKRFGLTGTWAYYCDRPATRTNYFEIYVEGEDGIVRREVNRGVPIAVSVVDKVQLISASVIKMRVRNSDPNWGPLNNFSYDVQFIKEDDPLTKEIWRIRGLRSIRSDGKILAKNGRYFGNRSRTEWEYKCRTPLSAASQNPPV
jgi:hypothetical protein